MRAIPRVVKDMFNACSSEPDESDIIVSISTSPKEVAKEVAKVLRWWKGVNHGNETKRNLS